MTTAVVAPLAAAVAVVIAGVARRPRPPGRQVAHEAPVRRRRPDVRRASLAVVVAGGAVLAGPMPIVLLAAATVGVWRLRRRRARIGRSRAVEAAMPDATELLVACLHAGRSPTQAVIELARLAPAPLRPAFAAVEQRLHRGHGLADALGELVEGGGPSALPLVTAVASALRDGLPLAPVLDRLSDGANASRRRQGEAAARRLPVRLSFPLVACTLPSFVLLSVAPAVLGALSSLRSSPL